MWEEGSLVYGEFLIRHKISRGGTSMVYRVEHTENGRIYALKVYSDTAFAKEAVRMEAASLMRLKGCRYVPVCVEKFPDSILMTMGSGVTLDEYVRTNGGMSPKHAAGLGYELSGVLRRIHNRKLLYLDLKPSNVLVREGRLEMLIDYGSAADMDGSKISAVNGTRGYAAPEQFERGGKLTVQTDIYGLGRTIQYALGSTMINGELGDILSRCTAEDPLLRPVNAGELQLMFGRLLLKYSITGQSGIRKALAAGVTAAVVIAAVLYPGSAASSLAEQTRKTETGRDSLCGSDEIDDSAGISPGTEDRETMTSIERLAQAGRELSEMQDPENADKSCCLELETELKSLEQDTELEEEDRKLAREYLQIVRTYIEWNQEDENETAKE